MARVYLLDELQWGFVDGPNECWIEVPRPAEGFGFPRAIYVDPFPAYAHDSEVVAAELDAVSAAFPLPEPFAPTVYLLAREMRPRVNASVFQQWNHAAEVEEGALKPWTGVIVVSAKRIPPHPGTTRYLVGHEYGHVVEDWIKQLRGEPEHKNDLLLEYADRRGMSPSGLVLSARGGVWHRAVQEVFACDFRVLVAGVEPDFWPHPGIPRPELVPGLAGWWAAQVPE